MELPVLFSGLVQCQLSHSVICGTLVQYQLLLHNLLLQLLHPEVGCLDPVHVWKVR